MSFLTIVIDLNPNLFRIGPFLVTWHGVFAVLGILAAARLGLWLLEKDGVDISRAADGVAWMVVLGLIGARLLYVWENFRLFSGGQLLRVFALTEGGISQWGGLFGALVGAYVWARRSRISYLKILDREGLNDLCQAFAATIREGDRPWIARFIEQLGHAYSSAQPLEEAQLMLEPRLTIRSQGLFANGYVAREEHPRYACASILVQHIDPHRFNPTRRCRAFGHGPPPRTANPFT